MQTLKERGKAARMTEIAIGGYEQWITGREDVLREGGPGLHHRIGFASPVEETLRMAKKTSLYAHSTSSTSARKGMIALDGIQDHADSINAVNA